MIEPKNYPGFQQELEALLEKHNVDNFMFSALCSDPNSDESDIPQMLNMAAGPGLSVQMVCAAFTQEILSACIQAMMKYCGLTVQQARGALTESLKSAATEIEKERQRKRMSASYRPHEVS